MTAATRSPVSRFAAGVNAKALSAYMGHSGVSITLDRYGRLMHGNEAEAADLLDMESRSASRVGLGGRLTSSACWQRGTSAPGAQRTSLSSARWPIRFRVQGRFAFASRTRASILATRRSAAIG